MVTTVGDHCGIAVYSRALREAIGDLVDMTVEPITPGRLTREAADSIAARLNLVDVVHVQHEHSFWGGILPSTSSYALLRARVRTPVVTTAHTVYRYEELLGVDREIRPLYRTAKIMLGLWAPYRRSLEITPFLGGHTIVHTRAAQRLLVQRGARESDVHVIPAGIPEALPADPVPESRRAEWRTGGRTVIAIFGFINQSKGYELALDALAWLPADTMLLIAGGTRVPGEASYLDGLRSQVADRGLDDRVVITGYLDQAAVGHVMALSDVVLYPHVIASGSYSLTMGLAHGRAILAADHPCFAEPRDDARCIELFRSGDRDDLVSKLRALIAHPEHRHALEKSALSYARARSWARAANETLRIYRMAAGAAYPTLPRRGGSRGRV